MKQSIDQRSEGGSEQARHLKDGKAGASTSPSTPARDPYLRPANEDDDGYDPYSDRREEPPFFEEDPWR